MPLSHSGQCQQAVTNRVLHAKLCSPILPTSLHCGSFELHDPAISLVAMKTLLSLLFLCASLGQWSVVQAQGRGPAPDRGPRVERQLPPAGDERQARREELRQKLDQARQERKEPVPDPVAKPPGMAPREVPMPAAPPIAGPRRLTPEQRTQLREQIKEMRRRYAESKVTPPPVNTIPESSR
jgi:uncharacterized membrane protein